MKILLTVHQFFPQYSAGTEILTYSVARELIRRGHLVHVFTGYPNSAELQEEDRFDEYDFEGIHVYRFHHAYKPMAGQTSLIEIGYDNRLAATYFGRALESFKPDMVHFFHLNRLGTGLIEVTMRADIPRYMTPTDFWTICPTGQLLYDDDHLCSGPSVNAGNCVKHFTQKNHGKLTRIIARRVPTSGVDMLVRLTQKGIFFDYPQRQEVVAIAARLNTNICRLNQLNGIIVPNKFMGDLLIRHGVTPHLITQSSFGVDITMNENIEPRTKPRYPLRVGFIGTHAPHKGCHVLIKAFKALPVGNAILKIYGNTEELSDYSIELKRLSENSAAIEFCGTFNNSKIGEVLADLDVLVVPSLWYENTPLVLYSAQGVHCPVVASDLPGISVVIQDDVNGLLFDAGNTEELTRKLSRLINECGLLRRLSSNSKKPKSIVTYVDELLNIWATG